MINQDSQIYIDFKQLQSLDQANQSKDFQTNHFAYLLQQAPIQQIALKCLDTNVYPIVPMRRTACQNCIKTRLSCYECPSCNNRKAICCRGFNCIYDYSHWVGHSNDPLYDRCLCLRQKADNPAFNIDWRLLNLMNKVKTSSSNISLYFGAGTLWIKTKHGQQQSIYFEDNYAILTYNQSNRANLNISNTRNLSNLLKVNLSKYLRSKEEWQMSNLQEECVNIVDKFVYSKDMQTMKAKLHGSLLQNDYSNMPSIRSSGKSVEISIFKHKIDSSIFEGYSNYTNQLLLFYYCYQSGLMFIRNAKLHEKDEEFSNIRCIQIHFQSRQAKKDSFLNAVWFKDKKGDIFSIESGNLSIFKYEPKTHKYCQIIIKKDPIFQKVICPTSLIYIPQSDRVYYFSPSQPITSFYFDLCRQNCDSKQEMFINSCCSVNITDKFMDQANVYRPAASIRIAYVIQQCSVAVQRDYKSEMIPIIYLLSERQLNKPIGLGLHKVINYKNKIRVQELVNVQHEKAYKTTVKFNIGVFFALKPDQRLRLYFQTYVDNSPTLIEGIIVKSELKDQQIRWKSYHSEVGLRSKQGLFIPNVKIVAQNHLNCPDALILNDWTGIALNNQIRLLGYADAQAQIVELCVTACQGTAEWHIFGL